MYSTFPCLTSGHDSRSAVYSVEWYPYGVLAQMLFTATNDITGPKNPETASIGNLALTTTRMAHVGQGCGIGCILGLWQSIVLETLRFFLSCCCVKAIRGREYGSSVCRVKLGVSLASIDIAHVGVPLVPASAASFRPSNDRVCYCTILPMERIQYHINQCIILPP